MSRTLGQTDQDVQEAALSRLGLAARTNVNPVKTAYDKIKAHSDEFFASASDV